MIEIEEANKIYNKYGSDYLEGIKLVAFDMDGVLLKNRNSWDVIMNRAMRKHRIEGKMVYTFDYLQRNGVPDHLYENLTETKIRTYINLNDMMANVMRTLEYLRERKIKTAIVSAGSHVFAGYIADLMGMDYYIGNEVDIIAHKFIKNVDPAKKDLNVSAIQTLLGVSPEETVSVGDSFMDLSMKRKSRYFVAFNPASYRTLEHSDFTVESTNLYDIISRLTVQ
jgi:phosphoserine phosphatase